MNSEYEYTIFPTCCLNISSSAVSQCSVAATKLLASSKVYNAEAITAGLEAAGLGGEVVIEANHQVRLLHCPRPVSTKRHLNCGCCCQATK